MATYREVFDYTQILDMDSFAELKPDGRRVWLSNKVIKERDEIRGSLRLSSQEMNCLQRILLGVSMVLTSMPGLKRLIGRAKAYQLAASAGGLLASARKIFKLVPGAQQKTIASGIEGTTIYISSGPHEYCLNLPGEAAYALASAAMHTCAYECERDARKARTCSLRQALDACAFVLPVQINDDYDPNTCPYVFAKINDSLEEKL